MPERKSPRLQRRLHRPTLRDRALAARRAPPEGTRKLRFSAGTGALRKDPGGPSSHTVSRREQQKRLRRIQTRRFSRRMRPGDENDPDVRARLRRQYQAERMAENAAEDARLRKLASRKRGATPSSVVPTRPAAPAGRGTMPGIQTPPPSTGPRRRETAEEILPERLDPDGTPIHAPGGVPTGPTAAETTFFGPPGAKAAADPGETRSGAIPPADGKGRPKAAKPDSGSIPTASAKGSILVPMSRGLPSSKLRDTAEQAAVAAYRKGQDDNDAVKASQRTADEGKRLVSRSVHARGSYSARLRESSARRQKVRHAPDAESGGPARREFQRRRQKRAYAASYRARLFGSPSGPSLAGEEPAATGTSLLRRLLPGREGDPVSRVFLWMLGILILILLLSMLTSGLLVSVSSGHGIVLTTYPSSDGDIYAAENGYRRLEQELEARLTSISLQYPGYEEYIMDLDDIGHDPYVLISYLTTYHWNFTEEDVREEIRDLFEAQYALTAVPGTRVRNGRTIRVLYVRLENRGLENVVRQRMDDEQTELFEALQTTKGNRDYLFNAANTAFLSDAGINYRVPEEALNDEQFARMLREAEKWLGWPYVWGGSSPADGGFDCSGYVCWVVNHCGNGWNVGRTTAEGLRRLCAFVSPSEARPGDLIFFQGTYNTEGASHVGIYVGNGMMINAGDPIKYADITTPYWQSHFMQFGRLPGANPGTAAASMTDGWTEEDRRLLADCIYWEARGQSFECQCYVGQVILNRVYDRRYPNTIRGVIGQPGQYANGIRSSPDPCYDAADAVLAGRVSMPRNVIYQAQFTQGTGVWKYLEGEYFCYG